ncbi:MAG: cobalt-precorrin-6A reductase [Cyanobacteria bacterium J06648_16]
MEVGVPTHATADEGKIWLIGGTQESAELARALADRQMACIVTVTTESARMLYPVHPCLTVWVGRLTERTFDDFLHQHRVVGVLDASHPFAQEISAGAIAAVQRQAIPYLRYERPHTPPDSSSTAVVTLPDLDTVFEQGWLVNQRVLLILGYRWLPRFTPWQSQAALYARILPSAIALETALQAGFTPQRLIALRPPISAALEAALWQQWRITTVIAKASGKAGGEPLKRRLARTLGVRLLLLQRPSIDYPRTTTQLSAAVEFCRQVCAGAPGDRTAADSCYPYVSLT